MWKINYIEFFFVQQTKKIRRKNRKSLTANSHDFENREEFHDYSNKFQS